MAGKEFLDLPVEKNSIMREESQQQSGKRSLKSLPQKISNLNCEICALIRGGLVGAVIGYFYPIILALPLNALLATRFSTSPMPSKENALRFWTSLSKPIFRKTRLAAFIQVALGAYLGSKHHEIYLKMLRIPEPGRDPEKLEE